VRNELARQKSSRLWCAALEDTSPNQTCPTRNGKWPAGIKWALVLLCLVVHGWALRPSKSGWPGTAHSFRIQPLPPAAGDEPFYRQEFIEDAPSVPQVHVASLCELSGGRLAASWYGGSREGARDVAIWFSVREPRADAAWSPARPIITRESASDELRRYVKKVGNPLVFSDGGNRLWLLYVSVALGGWSDSALNLKSSSDSGQSWAPSQRLTLSPFFNVGTLVKNKPAPIEGGGWVVPVYHELAGQFPELLWLRDMPGGMEATMTRIFGGRTAFQPALVPLDSQRALVLCRDTGRLKRVVVASTADGARHWSAPQLCSLPNPNSGLDALRLRDGRLLLVFNDSSSTRDGLRLGLSREDGQTWRRVATLEAEVGAEFSYPALIQTHDGLVHVAYTWKRQRIKHVAFNEAWLEQQTRTAPE
jgi:predicted neuraminidase